MTTSSANQLLNAFIADNERGGEKEFNGIKSKSIDEAVQSITRASTGWKDLKNTPSGETVEVTYKFSPGNGSWAVALNDDARAVYNAQLGRVADVANIKFTEYTGDKRADINIQVTPDRGNGGGSSYPSVTGADTDFKFQEKIGGGVWGNNLYIHEIGHSLGLAHPGDYNAGGKAASLTYAEDNVDFSVMSYNLGASKLYSLGLQIDDIAALQKLYGANNATRADDTVYGFNSSSSDKQFNILSGTEKLTFPFTIWDGGGNDTLDFSGFAQDQRIDLHDGTLSDVGGVKHGVGIAKNSIIENAIGGSGSDVLIGNSSDNYLIGNGGNDTIYGAGGADNLFGGAGSDTFVYRDKSDSLLSILGQQSDGGAITSLAEINLVRLVGSIDTILDFKSGEDKIDLSFLSENNKPLQLVHDLPSQNGQLSLTYFEGTKITLLTAHINSAQSTPDFAVKIIGQVDFAHDVIV